MSASRKPPSSRGQRCCSRPLSCRPLADRGCPAADGDGGTASASITRYTKRRKPQFFPNRILYLQQPLGVAVQQLLLILGAYRQRFRPLRSWRVVDKRVIDREQDPIDSHLHHAAQQGRIGEEAAGRDVKVLAEGIAKALAASAVPRQPHTDAPEIEGQAFAEMTENDLQSGIGIEHAAQDQTHSLGRGLDGKAPSCAQYRWVLLDVILVIGLDD